VTEKLTSRKLWMAVAGFATGVLLLSKGEGDLTGVIMALGSVVAYMVGNGLDSNERKKDHDDQ